MQAKKKWPSLGAALVIAHWFVDLIMRYRKLLVYVEFGISNECNRNFGELEEPKKNHNSILVLLAEAAVEDIETLVANEWQHSLVW